jgi:metal-responsive CopG/Arc/MetJ family transcriptional regulator
MTEKVPHRLSVSFPEGYYEALQRLADQKHVSVSWVIRDAVRAYVEAESPLYNELHRNSDDHVRTR